MIKNSKIMIILSCISAVIASLATIPYGYRFIHVFQIDNETLRIGIGLIAGLTAGLANAILGTYSIFHVEIERINKKNIIMIILAFLGAISTGFFCYFGYQSLLPITVNILVSIIVVLVNTAINFTAMNNFFEAIKNTSFTSISFNVKTYFSSFGFIIGLLVSSIAFLASSNGFTGLLLNHFDMKISLIISYYLATVVWIPAAALYANSNRIVAHWIYDSFSNHKTIRWQYLNLFIFLFAIISGSSMGEIVLEFFNPNNYIPDFLKFQFVMNFAHYFLSPAALISTAGVNYFAFSELRASLRLNAKQS